MTDFLRWLITALASIAAILIVFALAAVSVFAVGILFIIIFIISLVSYCTGKNIYTTKFMYASNKDKDIFPRKYDDREDQKNSDITYIVDDEKIHKDK